MGREVGRNRWFVLFQLSITFVPFEAEQSRPQAVCGEKATGKTRRQGNENNSSVCRIGRTPPSIHPAKQYMGHDRYKCRVSLQSETFHCHINNLILYQISLEGSIKLKLISFQGNIYLDYLAIQLKHILMTLFMNDL